MSTQAPIPLAPWSRLCYLLASFNVVVVVASLYFGHQSIELLRSSLQTTLQSERRAIPIFTTLETLGAEGRVDQAAQVFRAVEQELDRVSACLETARRRGLAEEPE